MRLTRQTVLGLALAAFVLPGGMRPALADPPAPKINLKPDVAALLKQSTDAYKKMKSYRHTAVFVAELKDPMTGQTLKQVNRYTLALERPNKFVYKNDTQPTAAAVSDGKTFINFRADQTTGKLQYTKATAPADYKGINIVDDVTFEPLATYVIALMLQGDALADKDVRAALETATLKPGTVTENGKKWQVVAMMFQQDPMELYFSADDHLIGKAVQRSARQGLKIVETDENVSINKPMEATVFQYTPPAEAKKIDKFLPAQKPDDARNTPRSDPRKLLTRLPADRRPTPRI